MEKENTGWNLEQKLSIITTSIILLVPTYGTTLTKGGHQIWERVFYWPWLFIIHLEPVSDQFGTDMYNFIHPPITLIIFIPFLWGLKLCYDQFHGNGEKERISGLIALTSILQLFIIWITYQSQDPTINITEEITIYFIPQLLVLFIQGYFAVKWYYSKVQSILNTPAKTKQEN